MADGKHGAVGGDLSIPRMPRWLYAWASRPRWQLVSGVVAFVGVFGLALGSSGTAGLVALLIVVLVVSVVREWVYIEDTRYRSSDGEVHRLRRALERATDGNHADYAEDPIICFYIGDSPGQDRMSTHLTTKVEGHEVLVWRRVENDSDYPPPDDLAQLNWAASDDEGRLESVVVKQDGARVSTVVFLRAPLKAAGGEATYSWSYRCDWPGLWTTLRDQGADELHVRVTHPATRLVLRLFFPSTLKNPPQSFATRTPVNAGIVRTIRDESGLSGLEWVLEHPTVNQEYVAHVECAL